MLNTNEIIIKLYGYIINTASDVFVDESKSNEEKKEVLDLENKLLKNLKDLDKNLNLFQQKIGE